MKEKPKAEEYFGLKKATGLERCRTAAAKKRRIAILISNV